MSFANMSLEQMEAYLAQDKAEQKQERSKKKAERKAATPVTSGDWSKEHDDNSGITYHVHGPSGAKVFNNLTGSYKWEVKGSGITGRIHKTLQEAKNAVETEHAKGLN
jgi:hypothetical protein